MASELNVLHLCVQGDPEGKEAVSVHHCTSKKVNIINNIFIQFSTVYVNYSNSYYFYIPLLFRLGVGVEMWVEVNGYIFWKFIVSNRVSENYIQFYN